MYMGERWLGEAETEWGLALPYAITARADTVRHDGVVSGSPFTEAGH
jgi:hypothetical protein